jgi:hypothetical protein
LSLYSKSEVDNALAAKANTTDVDTALDDKVDKVAGKGLSTEDYTTDEKTKLADIAAGAEVNVQSDWNQSTDSADDYIKNKPLFNTAYNASTNKAATMSDITTSAENGTLTGYEKKTGNVAATDKIVEAIGKLETKADTNENNILYNIKDGVQNIFQLAAGTRTAGGVTFTINADGTITLSNTATSDAVFIISENLNVSDDTYVLYGDGFITGIFMDTYETGYTNRRTFTTSVVTNSNTKIWRLIISSGTNCNGVTIRPMLCLKSLYDADPTYQPYAMSNAELTAAIQALQAQLNQ